VASRLRAQSSTIYYIDAFIIRASDVRDDLPLAHQTTFAAMRHAPLYRLDHHLDQRSPLDHDAQAAIWPRRQVEQVLHGARPKAPPQQLLVYFALVFVIVAGTAAVLTVVAPQSAVADGGGYGGS
jgi:hypothetical protein